MTRRARGAAPGVNQVDHVGHARSLVERHVLEAHELEDATAGLDVTPVLQHPLRTVDGRRGPGRGRHIARHWCRVWAAVGGGHICGHHVRAIRIAPGGDLLGHRNPVAADGLRRIDVVEVVVVIDRWVVRDKCPQLALVLPDVAAAVRRVHVCLRPRRVREERVIA